MISTHVLDISIGSPAAWIPVDLEFLGTNSLWTKKFSGQTNLDGRISEMLPIQESVESGRYRLIFQVENYFNSQGFYPIIEVTFVVNEGIRHYHVPILISPFGYSTYRGS
jgi:5-hydroxyisourate hydrolase